MKKLIVVNNNNLKVKIESILKNNKKCFVDDYDFDFASPIYRINDEKMHIRKIIDKYYICGKSEPYIHRLFIKYFNLPENIFVEHSTIYFQTHLHDKYDEIICACSNDICGFLSFCKYIERCTYPQVKKICIDVDEENDENLKNALLNETNNFEEKLKQTQKLLITEDFSLKPTKSVESLREEFEMNRSEFAKYFGIPYRTVENWCTGKNKCPEYLFDLMEFKLIKSKLKS